MKSPAQSLRNHLALTALFFTSLAVTSAEAQNPNFTNGDLVMGFQLRRGPGSDQTVLVDLGDTATIFRDATSDIFNIVSIGTVLESVFGLGAGNALHWYENPDLYFGLEGVWSASALGSALQHGDPARTLYTSKSRIAGGIEGLQNSAPETIAANGSMAAAANPMLGLQGVLEHNYTTRSAVIPTSMDNTWEDDNPFNGDAQAPAFGQTFNGGIQQAFAAGSYGSFSLGTVEGALDLYRFQAVNNISGQYGQGAPVREPEFEGTIVIDQNGNISFLAAVPEPSSALLLAASSLLGGFIRRRPARR